LPESAKNVERRREAAVLCTSVSNVPKSAEGRFRSFETGDYSNEIMGLASAAGFCRVSQGINRDEPDATRAMQLNSCMHAA
jgi:hypothetical protein